MIELTAKEVMTENVLAAGADWTIEQLAEFLVDNSISGAPVTSESGDLIGVVSSTDIVRHDSLPVEDMRSEATHEYYFRGMDRQLAEEEIASFRIKTGTVSTVRDIMTPMIFDVLEDTPVSQIGDTMVRGSIHRVFVTREKKIVGIITALDVLKTMLEISQ